MTFQGHLAARLHPLQTWHDTDLLSRRNDGTGRDLYHPWLPFPAIGHLQWLICFDTPGIIFPLNLFWAFALQTVLSQYNCLCCQFEQYFAEAGRARSQP